MQSIKMKYERADRFRSIQSNPVKAKRLRKNSVSTGANSIDDKGFLKISFLKTNLAFILFYPKRFVSRKRFFFVSFCKSIFFYSFFFLNAFRLIILTRVVYIQVNTDIKPYELIMLINLIVVVVSCYNGITILANTTQFIQ